MSLSAYSLFCSRLVSCWYNIFLILKHRFTDLEAHSGLYTLRTHLNHGCTPNASVRHLDQRRALVRITVRALTDIEPGKELLITYVDHVAGTRSTAPRWQCGGSCPSARGEGRDWKPPEGQEGLADLVSELKAGWA
ncbi:hypothetical protein K438DRAFT_4577 [Mycena galopus ATCC 62051]|nr:hypothetical protein K438DRAFT_4577 [Mycena galopus ATCC 62051]